MVSALVLSANVDAQATVHLTTDLDTELQIMKTARFVPTRIDLPAWACSPKVRLYEISQPKYEATQGHRGTIMDLVHDEVTKYLNTPDLVFVDEEGFPNISRMTGEYYLSDESYELHCNPEWIQIGIMTRFLEKKRLERQVDLDYLGLEVWIRGDPTTWDLEILGVDSSSI